jgi:hypothetical protein
MTRKRIHTCVAAAAFLSPGSLITMHSQELGTITFATSAAPTAQPAFLEGVKDLHSFQFDEAAVAFQKAQQTDPGFALAYWGEAMRLAKEAVTIELTMAAPSGPPEPIKPSLELYGDILLDAGRTPEAAVAYEQELLRTPKRTPSVKGLARAKSAAGATR